MAVALLHFVCGSTGAGKTTYAERLAQDVKGVRFSIDEWMSALFWKDAPDPIEASWAMERVDRCSDVIWRTTVAIARSGIACVLEVGLTTRVSREAIAARAAAASLPYTLHFIDVDAGERWRRVQARNSDMSGELGFAVTREMFDFVETMWERPSNEEMLKHHGIRITDV